MGKSDAQAQAIAQLTLNFLLPGAALCAIAAASVGQDEVVGSSWEGFVIENLMAAAPLGTVPMFYRTTTGAEIDLLLEMPGEGSGLSRLNAAYRPVPRKDFT